LAPFRKSNYYTAGPGRAAGAAAALNRWVAEVDISDDVNGRPIGSKRVGEVQSDGLVDCWRVSSWSRSVLVNRRGGSSELHVSCDDTAGSSIQTTVLSSYSAIRKATKQKNFLLSWDF